MADVRPLRGVRFARERTGSVGTLLAPPYDVAAASGSAPAFSIRHIEGVDLGNGADNHRVAAARYRDWRQRGVLVPDAEPAIYIHRHTFPVQDETVTRTGILARVRLRDWAERVVLPHERTNVGPRAERLDRLRAVGANLSPLYFLTRDADGSLRDLIAAVGEEGGEAVGSDHMGGVHRLQVVADEDWQTRLREAFGERQLFVADGHHRYEAALTYRNERRQARASDSDDAAEFVLALIAAVEDPGVVVRPTHRMLTGAGPDAAAVVLEMARKWFDVRAGGVETPRGAGDFIGRLALPAGYGTWNLRARDGQPHLDLLAGDRGAAWRSLPVAAVEGMHETMMAARVLPETSRLVPVVDISEVERSLGAGEAQAAFLLRAPEMDRLLAVAEEGDLLPAKSTWFEPKAPAGLVINDLSE